MPIIVRVAAVAVALTFAWAGAAKLARFGVWRRALEGYRLPAAVRAVAALAVPAVEVAIAALIVSGRLLVGAGTALFAVALFSLALVRAHAGGSDRLPCGCFGRTTTRDARLLLVRNLALAVPIAVVLVQGKDHDVFTGIGAPSGSEAVAALLVAAGMALIGWILYEVGSSWRHREGA